MTNGTSDNRLDRIEAAIAALAERQEQFQVQQERGQQQIVKNHDDLMFLATKLTETVSFFGNGMAQLTEKVDALVSEAAQDRQQAAIDRQTWQANFDRQQAEIQRIWEHLSQGRNGYSNGGNGGQ